MNPAETKSLINTPIKGMNQDIAPEYLPKDKYETALNGRVYSTEKGVALKFQNMRGDQFFMSFPEVPAHSVWQMCFVQDCGAILPEVCECDDFTISINITTTFPTGDVVTNFNGSGCFPDIYYNLANDINTNNPQPTNPLHATVGGATGCNCISVESLDPTGNITDITVTGSTNIFINGITAVTLPIQSGITFIGGDNSEDELIVVTTNDTTEEGGIGQIWQIDITGVGIPPGLDPGQKIPLSMLRYNANMGVSRRHQVIDAEYQPENSCFKRFYWTDNHNPPREINLSEPATGLIALLPETLSLTTPDVVLPDVTFKRLGQGKLPSGVYQYVFRYKTPSGVFSAQTPPTYHINVIDRAFNGYKEVFSDVIGVNSGKSVVLTITNLDPRYTEFQVIALYSIAYGSPPSAAYIVADQTFFSDTVEVEHIENGTTLGFISVPEAILPPVSFARVKNMKALAGRLVLSNVCDYEDIRYTPPFTHEFICDTVLLDNIVPTDAQYFGQTGPVTMVDPLNGIELFNDYRDFKGAKIAHERTGLRRGGEKYRDGIVFYNLQGLISSANWLADVITPVVSEAGPCGQYVTQSAPSDQCSAPNTPYEIYGHPLGERFVIDLSTMPNRDQISGFSIVRVPRDPTILASGWLRYNEIFTTRIEGVAGVTDVAINENLDWRFYCAPDGHVGWLGPDGLAFPSATAAPGAFGCFVETSGLDVAAFGIAVSPPAVAGGIRQDALDILQGTACAVLDPLKNVVCMYSPEVDFNFPTGNAWQTATELHMVGYLESQIRYNPIAPCPSPFNPFDYLKQDDFFNFYPNSPATFNLFGGQPVGQGQIRKLTQFRDGAFASGATAVYPLTKKQLFGNFEVGDFGLPWPINLAPPPTIRLGDAQVAVSSCPVLNYTENTSEHPGRGQVLYLKTQDPIAVDDIPITAFPIAHILTGGLPLGGHQCQWKAHTNPASLVLANLVRPNSNQYGGDTAAAKAANQYIFAGHYQAVDSCNTGDTPDSYIYTADVYGADTMIVMSDRMPNYNFTDKGFSNNLDASTRDRLGRELYLNGALVPLETSVNVTLRRYTSPKVKLDYATPQTFDNTKGEDFSYNDVHSYEEQTRMFKGYNTETPECLDTCSPQLVTVSHLKAAGESRDSWSQFDLAERQLMDIKGGSITHMDVLKDTGQNGHILYLWMSNQLTLSIQFDARALIGGANGDQVSISAASALGAGKIMLPYQYLSRLYGSIHKASFVNTKGNSIWWWDQNTHSHCKLSQAGIEAVSVRAGMHSFFQNNALLNRPLPDNPLWLGGISGGYNHQHNEVIFTACPPIGEDNLFPNFVQGTFEGMTDPEMLAEFVFTAGTNYLPSIGTTSVFQGLQDLQLVIFTQGSPTAGIVWSHLTPVTLLPNTTYQISAWVRLLDAADELDTGAELAIRFNTGEFVDATVIQSVKWTKGVDNVLEWVQISLTFKTGTGPTNLTGKFAFTISENTPLLRTFEGEIAYDSIYLTQQETSGFSIIYNETAGIDAYMTFWGPTPRMYLALPGNRLISANIDYNAPSDIYWHWNGPDGQFNIFYGFPNPATTSVKMWVPLIWEGLETATPDGFRVRMSNVWDRAIIEGSVYGNQGAGVRYAKCFFELRSEATGQVVPMVQQKNGLWTFATPKTSEVWNKNFDGTPDTLVGPNANGDVLSAELIAVTLEVATTDYIDVTALRTNFKPSPANE